MRLPVEILKATICVCFCCLVIESVAQAQSSRDRRRDDSVSTERALEVRLQKAEEALVNEYKDVAVELYRQGNKEKAMSMLARLQELSPNLEGLQDRIDAITEELLQENARELTIDTRKGSWEFVGDVSENKSFRIAAAGEFRMTMMTTVTVDGIEPDEKAKDHIPGAPLGCLIGVVVTSDGKPGRPFAVKSELEMKPKKTGKLFLKLNVPDGTQCVGKLRVRLSGYITNPSAR